MSIIVPPGHVHLRDGDRPFWDSIVKLRDGWTTADLELAGQLARCKSDIEVAQQHIDREGHVVTTDSGRMVVNSWHARLESLTNRAIALTRLLRIDCRSLFGRARDGRKRFEAEQSAREAMTHVDGNLIPFGARDD